MRTLIEILKEDNQLEASCSMTGKKKKYEAVGDAAECFYDLQDEYCGDECPSMPHKTLIDELVRYLSGDQLQDFCDDFRRHHMNEMAEEAGETCDDCGCVIENPDPNCDCNHDHSANEELDYLRKLAGM